MNGGFVNTQNKVTVTDLQKGTFNSGGELAKNTVCNWSIETKYTTCSQGLHSNGEPAGSGEPGSGTCAAETTSQLVVMVVGDCKALGDDGDGGGNIPGPISPGTTSPGTGGGLGNGQDDGSGNNEFPPNEPGDCNGGLTAPQTPNYDISDGGCGSIPSQPTLPLPKNKTPCEVLKENSENPKIQNKLDSLKTRVLPSTPNYDKHETMVSVFTYQGKTQYSISTTPLNAGSNTQSIQGTSSDFDIATIHNHTVKSSFPAPSHIDVVTFYDTYKLLIPNRKKNYIFYITCYNGVTYALKMNDATAWDAFFAEFPNLGTATTPENEKKLAWNKVMKFYKKYGFDKDKIHTQEESEKIFLKALEDPLLGQGDGAFLYRKNNDTDSWGKLKLVNGVINKEDCPL